LFFDQRSSRARIIAFPGPERADDYQDWLPLETILKKWLMCWDRGLITLTYDEEDPGDEWGRSALLGWNHEMYYRDHIPETFRVWEEYLAAIEERVPGEAFDTTPAPPRERPAMRKSCSASTTLGSDHQPDQPMPAKQDFPEEWFIRARQPARLKSGRPLRIAPGLIIPPDAMREANLDDPGDHEKIIFLSVHDSSGRLLPA
jgi:hypothetical protein